MVIDVLGGGATRPERQVKNRVAFHPLWRGSAGTDEGTAPSVPPVEGQRDQNDE
jgi:hypothetical protein